MNLPTPELEKILRSAPRPPVPSGLREQLAKHAPHSVPAGCSPSAPLRLRTWLAGWWPALAAASVTLACLIVLGVQQGDLRQLEQEVRSNRGALEATSAAAPAVPAPPTVADLPDERAEMARLKEEVARLSGEIAALKRQAEADQKARAAAAAAPAANQLSAEEVAAMEAARDRARSIQCINNLKQLGLAARIWATDNGDVLPPDWLSMTNEMNTPKILVCPADEGRAVAADWSAFSGANVSYEFLAPSAPETEPNRVLYRCPIHGHVGLCDGSVQSEVATKRPEHLIERDGKLYLE